MKNFELPVTNYSRYAAMKNCLIINWSITKQGDELAADASAKDEGTEAKVKRQNAAKRSVKQSTIRYVSRETKK